MNDEDLAPAVPEPTPRDPRGEDPDDGGMDVDGVEEILRSLMPEAGTPVSFLDRWGRAHEAMPLASISQQLRLKDLFSGIDMDATLNLGKGAAAMIALLTNPAVAGTLVAAFEILHEDAVDEARDMATERYKTAPAADLFPAEEMAKAIIPFCVRPLLEALDLLSPAASAMGLIG